MTINIIDFGAKPDGVTLNTESIQRAIDTAAKGDGRVTVPRGVFKTGTIWLRSGVELHLDEGAELLASDDHDDYNERDAYEQNYDCLPEKWVGKHLIIAHEVENVSITGHGKINGNCRAFAYRVDSDPEKVYGWCHGRSEVKDKEKLRPGQLVCFIESKNIKVEGITLVDSPCWTVFIHGCDGAEVSGVTIRNPIWMLNSDGIDIDASRNVTVHGCDIDTGDDAITLRASEQRLKNKNIHCENVTVRDCVLRSGICAFRIGVGYGVIRGARISDIKIKHCLNIIQFCTAYNDRGCANIEDLHLSRVTAVGADRLFEAFARNDAYIRDVLIEDVTTTSTIGSYAKVYNGEINGFALKNLSLTYSDKATDLAESQLEYRGSNLLKFDGVKGLKLDGVKVYGSFYGVTEPFAFEDCDTLKENCNF